MRKILYSLLIIICFAALFSLSFFQARTLKTSGNLYLNNMSSEVTVHFDDFGIPHIQGDVPEDVYRVLGYITASERLFQMDIYRRLVQGRLSELFGEKTIEADKLLRTLRFKKSAQEILAKSGDKIPAETLRYAESFLAGVGEFIEKGNLPVEFYLLNYRPEPFDLADVMGLTSYMALTFAEGINGDIFLSELSEKLPEDKMKLLRSGANTDSNFFPEQKIVKSDVLQRVNRAIDQIADYAAILHGSNSWILAPQRTKSGAPILANDPHIGAANPHVFYEAHIKTPNIELYGNYIPLVPFPVMGHTPNNAWGLTMAEVDDLNIYLEKINPDDPNQVMYKNEWTEIQSYAETIKVKDGADVNITVRLSPHGPFLDDTRHGIKGKHLSVSWSVYHPENLVLRSLYDIPRASTVAEFREAVSHAAAPGLNISWISRQGDIAWWILGKYPKLPEGVATDLVLNGWDGSHEIERYYTIDENPHLINPPEGVIVTANYRPQLSEFSYLDGYWQPGGRYFRIEKLLRQKQQWSVEELKKIQTDDTIPIFETMKKQLVQNIQRDQLDDYEKQVLNLFENWDGKSDRSSVGSSIYHMWNYYNTFNLFQDELGKKGFEKLGKTADFFHSYKTALFDLNHSIWDNVKTNRVESGSEQITRSFKEALLELKERLGHRFQNWRWGRLHTAEYIHPLGRVKPLNVLFNIGPVEANGGRYVINNLGHKKASTDFRVVHGPATRRLIDMNNPRQSWGILPTGNSGNLFSKHFSDQTKLYHEGQYRPQLMDWNEIQELPVLKVKKAKK